MPHADAERRKLYQRDYFLKNRKSRIAYKKAWRRKNPDKLIQEARRHRRIGKVISGELKQAHWMLNNAVRDRKIVRPDHCSNCGKKCTPQGHHHNGYDQEHWFDVVWLCQICHSAAHY